VELLVFLILAAVIAYFFLRSKKGRVEFVTETRVNTDQFRKYNDLMKESTALKKAGKFNEAVEKIKEAYKEAQEKSLTLTVNDYLKLPPYLQKAGKNDEAWAWFNDLIRSFASDPMSLSQIYGKLGLFRERENNPKDAIKYNVLSSMYWCLGLHEQVTQQGWTDRKPELTCCKQSISDGYGKILKKAGCEHLEDGLKKLITEHMRVFPNIRMPDVVRDINKLVSEKAE
jgi:tetratricopeptide (TPR) repeat protein